MHMLENNLSEGNLFRQLIGFSFPFLLSNLIQSLYGVADMVIVGQFVGSVGMAGVNIGSQVGYLLSTMIQGFSVGGTVLVGHAIGTGNRKEQQEIIATLMTSFIALSVVFSVLMLLLQNPILRIIRTPVEAFADTRSYYVIITIGLIFVFLFNGLSAIMRGMGNSKSPLLFVSIACGFNILLDLLLVGSLRMGAGGAALATIVSQAISVLLCVFYLLKRRFPFDFKPRSFRIKKDTFSHIIQLGMPGAIQRGATNLSFLMLTAMANTMGVYASAAVAAGSKINSLAIQPGLAMSASITALTAQNLGAKQTDRAVRATWIGAALIMGIDLILFGTILWKKEWFLGMFSADRELLQLGAVYLGAVALDWLAVPFHFALNGLFVGAGKTNFCMMTSILSSLLLRIPIAYLIAFRTSIGLAGLGYSAAVATFLMLLVDIGYFFSNRWKSCKLFT